MNSHDIQINIAEISYTADVFGIEPAENLNDVYAQLIKADIESAQANLNALPEHDRRGLTMDTLRHFNCGYLQNWVVTKCRAEFLCGIYVDDLTREPKCLPPPSPRIIRFCAPLNGQKVLETTRRQNGRRIIQRCRRT